MLAMTLALGGCGLFGVDTGYRSLTIRNHQFEPAKITVPTEKPFILTVDAVDPARRARLPLGPLKAGRYTIFCTCHGQSSTAVIVAR
jgi:hypothetical protein